MQTGAVVVEKVRGKSTVIRCFSKYPLKFIVPRKAGPSTTDVVWIYSLTYGGGIVSGDCISCDLIVGDGCAAVFTTQASTKVYKSMGSKCSEQVLEARVGADALLVIVPEPVTCFFSAMYTQKQIFKVALDSSLVIVDWITSGRHESGEIWDFELYKSTNHIFLEDAQPLFLDTVLLEKGSFTPIVQRMQGYRVLAMIVIMGPKTLNLRTRVQDDVKRMMSGKLYQPSAGYRQNTRGKPEDCLTKPEFLCSCSVFGPKGLGTVVRVAAMTTESVYKFLQHQLADMEPLLGISPYR